MSMELGMLVGVKVMPCSLESKVTQGHWAKSNVWPTGSAIMQPHYCEQAEQSPCIPAHLTLAPSLTH